MTGRNGKESRVAPRKRRLNPAHRRRALELLASSPHGATEKLLVVAHGFDNDMIASLVRHGLATADREIVKAGAKAIEVVRVRITAAGRKIIES
jgi:hypothetical protein